MKCLGSLDLGGHCDSCGYELLSIGEPLLAKRFSYGYPSCEGNHHKHLPSMCRYVPCTNSGVFTISGYRKWSKVGDLSTRSSIYTATVVGSPLVHLFSSDILWMASDVLAEMGHLTSFSSLVFAGSGTSV